MKEAQNNGFDNIRNSQLSCKTLHPVSVDYMMTLFHKFNLNNAAVLEISCSFISNF